LHIPNKRFLRSACAIAIPHPQKAIPTERLRYRTSTSQTAIPTERLRYRTSTSQKRSPSIPQKAIALDEISQNSHTK
ncbi:hypothetical protein VB711_19465, partial [Cronbergia sp. UHCC 0137]|uniref:hypothetical protein n=1 Tax=Cronbergia sp. UHCC 0137 TaxID=3110239 RepID=UPI002B20F9B5